MRMTIKEIAELAGVSRATVSKIINNYDDVGEKTKKRVLDIMEQHNYRPSYSAQTLARKKTNVIGVIYAGEVNADFNHPFFVEVIDAFKKQIGFMGYDLLFFSNEKFHKEEEDFLERCRHYNVDGCIVISGGNVQPSVYELDKSEIPCVGLEIQLNGPNSSFVMSDNHQLIELGVDHLVDLGIQNIAYIGGLRGSLITKLREESFRFHMKEKNLPIKTNWMLEGDFFEESGYNAVKKLLLQNELPQAIFASADMMAFGAMRAIKESAYSLEDFAIIGLDDIPASRYVNPALTTIRQDKVKLGETAATLLHARIEELEVEQGVYLPGELVVRESCGYHRRKAFL
ncbi:LacI family DNA-binding transcriptional regulator [Alkalicoccus daliensis]|uniref:Transcriptional regulator, LacI family n=1 Tax=Alkalicoccus daliensis TaxID=745820 RepID=A0A1H0L7W6_9BACI|nr:LacI family DNA-binding transcriptional regulator [Alkalicoccus daliensis]SDO64040.1 transcriptional regulator, LacI family [Alkalicoccus daliensis]